MSVYGPVVLVVGLQKSGTSLLLRLLSGTDAFRNPVRFEGKELWGDDPPFAPEAFPAGTFYQRDGGSRGHELGAAEATPDVIEHLSSRLARAARPGTALVLKNPYNTVRVPWLRAALPEARIVAVVRRPLPNVFSLAKKHAENPHVHRGPEEGWWGVKPAGWRDLLDDDRVLQSARQWERVNAKLLADSDLINRVVAYHELCTEPERIVAEIAGEAVGRVPETDFPDLSPLDDEHRTGGPLESANKVYKRTGGLDLAGAERAGERLEAFTDAQRDAVLEVCGEAAEALGLGNDPA
jgi:Sulfotransferase family